MVSLSSKSAEAAVLEPSSGQGVFLSSLQKAGHKNYIGYEIDETLISANDNLVKNESFVSAKFDESFDLVIGNPPYVRWKNMDQGQKDELNTNHLWAKYFNSLSDYLYIFVLKSVELLKENGELIFITPEYWLNTMHSQTLRDYLLRNGYMQEIYHFSETPIFNKVASSIIIFKYVKSSSQNRIKKPIRVYKYSSKKRLTEGDLGKIENNDSWDMFEIKQFDRHDDWILAPEKIKRELLLYEDSCRVNFDQYHNPKPLIEDEVPYMRLGDISNIANGLVSGLDKAFQLPSGIRLNQKESLATLDVIKAKDMQSFVNTGSRKYIFLNNTPLCEEELIKEYPNFYAQLSLFKDDLLKRYSYNRDINYWDWVFLRSIGVFVQNEVKIFVPCKERITNKSRLRFCLASENSYPTQDVTAIYINKGVREDIRYLLALLNSRVTYDWIRYKGLIKGGIAEFSERPLSSIPIRLIDWSNDNDIKLHHSIVSATKDILGGDSGSVDKIDRLILELLS